MSSFSPLISLILSPYRNIFFLLCHHSSPSNDFCQQFGSALKGEQGRKSSFDSGDDIGQHITHQEGHSSSGWRPSSPNSRQLFLTPIITTTSMLRSLRHAADSRDRWIRFVTTLPYTGIDKVARTDRRIILSFNSFDFSLSFFLFLSFFFALFRRHHWRFDGSRIVVLYFVKRLMDRCWCKSTNWVFKATTKW